MKSWDDPFASLGQANSAVAMVVGMVVQSAAHASPSGDRGYFPDHLPSGAALLAVQLSEEARGIRGLDVLRRSVDRAPPSRF